MSGPIKSVVRLKQEKKSAFLPPRPFLFVKGCFSPEQGQTVQQAVNKPASEAVTTGNRVTRRSNLSPDGPPELTKVHKLLIEYMTFGCHHPNLLAKIVRPAVIDPDTGETLKPERNPLPGDQLTLEEASELVGMRRRTARILLASPIGQKALARAVQSLRDGAKVEAMRAIIAVMQDPGEGKAADRKVRLEAADRILGLDQTKQQSAVTVNINNATTINPGYVIRDPRQAAQVIDLTAEQSGD